MYRTAVEPLPDPAPARRLTPLRGAVAALLLLTLCSGPRACAPAPQQPPPPPAPMTLTCPPYCEALAGVIEGHRIRVTCDC